jgi:DNA-binding response OmpR family regulator
MSSVAPNRLSSRNYPVAATAAQPKRVTPTILIAEDSRDSREMLEVLLLLRGYDVLTAEDGPTALQLALANVPSLILLDLGLPKLDGLSVARHLRSYASLTRVPIVMLSGHDPMEYKQPALDAGCTDYLLKPLDFRKLDEILEHEVPL